MMPPEVKKEKVMQAAPTNKAQLKRVIRSPDLGGRLIRTSR